MRVVQGQTVCAFSVEQRFVTPSGTLESEIQRCPTGQKHALRYYLCQSRDNVTIHIVLIPAHWHKSYMFAS